MDHSEAWQEIAERRHAIIEKQTEEISTLKTKLAMRDQQLREADALVARLRVDVDQPDAMVSDLKGLAARELRPEQYADGAGAQAWRQAMGGESLCLCPATSEYDPPCPRHGVLGIGKTGTP